jgi:hypothetical protein
MPSRSPLCELLIVTSLAAFAPDIGGLLIEGRDRPWLNLSSAGPVTSLTAIWRIASTVFWPCETRTSTCRNFATISSGLYRFLAITVLLDVKDIPQVGPLRWGRIKTHRWSKDFLEAGKKRLGGDTARAATSDEVKEIKRHSIAQRRLQHQRQAA